MPRRLATTAVPALATLFLAGWLASLVLAPACTPLPPRFGFNLVWAALIGPFVAWGLMVRLWRLARPPAVVPEPVRWPLLAGVLLSIGTVGCALSLGCAPLEAHWLTWDANDPFYVFAQWPSKWKLVGMAGMFGGLLGLVVVRFKRSVGSAPQ